MTINPPTDLLFVDPAKLALTQERLANDDLALAPALAALRLAASQALATPVLSVTYKQRMAPSGDPHDYLSIGPYWWPDPAAPDGLPYIRRDGERNPETEQYDSPRLKQLVAAVNSLAWGGFFTCEQDYLQHAALLVRAWFLEESTRMNPHLDYGQFIPGVCEGRGIGIIDTSTLFPTLLDAVQVLVGSGALTPAEDSAIHAWMAAYLDWSINSANGREEAVQHNNHGTWYDVQLAALALLNHQPDLAARVCDSARERRIQSQIQPDGSQPHELARTRSLSYSTMNLTAFLNLAVLAEQVGVDLLNYEGPDGRSIRWALEWLLPYAANRQPWTGQQITPVEPGAFISLFRRAAIACRELRFEQVQAAWPQESPTNLVSCCIPCNQLRLISKPILAR